MSRIRLALFPSYDAAVPFRDQLRATGIQAEIHQELQLQRLWFVSKSAAGARLEVSFTDWDRATQLIREWDLTTGALRQAIRCPECRSLRVDFPQFTNKSFLTNLAMGLLAELNAVKREYYCEECHCMWSPKQKAVRPRAHQSPNYFIEGLNQRR